MTQDYILTIRVRVEAPGPKAADAVAEMLAHTTPEAIGVSGETLNGGYVVTGQSATIRKVRKGKA